MITNGDELEPAYKEVKSMKKQIITTQEKQFSEVLQQIQTAKQQVFQQVNKALVQLYWNIGAYSANWGKRTVEQLASFIQQKEPNVSGFTASNIWRMKQFYETYADNSKLATLWRELPWSHNHRSRVHFMHQNHEIKI